MSRIIKATINDIELLAAIGKQSFIESHGHSAPQEDIDYYVNEKYSAGFFKEELSNARNIYHLIYQEGKPAGYSKIIFNSSPPNIERQYITKMERLYLLKDFYPFKLGQALFNFNLDLSKANQQTGMWLFVWQKNQRAIRFYIKNGFTIIGSHDFAISATHSNPNHQMLLKY